MHNPRGNPRGILPCDSGSRATILAYVKSVSELNKRRVQLFVQAVLNEGRLELIDELVANDYVGYVPWVEAGVTGPKGVRQLVSTCLRAHPGMHIKIEDQIAEDDQVVTRWRTTTTRSHEGSTGDPAERPPCYAGISIIRLLAGKQVESRTEYALLNSGTA
jgi:predicted SnoaL-like aldol condensation-catalyzing enzyme